MPRGKAVPRPASGDSTAMSRLTFERRHLRGSRRVVLGGLSPIRHGTNVGWRCAERACQPNQR
jgi:hypothetical protein